jgi:curli biogenesis system outer membrane secretion channel CsgG
MLKWTPKAASTLLIIAVPLSVAAGQNAPPNPPSPALGQGPGAWRGPKLRVGVMDLTGSALGAVSSSPGMGGAVAMQPMPMPMAGPAGVPGQVVAAGPVPGQIGVPAGPPGVAPSVSGIVSGVVSNAVTTVMPATQPQPMMQPTQPQYGQPQPQYGQPQSPMTPSTPGSIPPPPGFAVGLTEMLTTALTQQSQFIVLERSKVDQVLNEQSFGASGRVDPASAAQAGKVLGAQVLIFGNITEYSEHQSSVGGGLNVLKNLSGQVGASVSKVTAQIGIDLRLVDASTGQVVSSVRGEGKASATGIATNFQAADKNLGVGGTAQTPLGQASRAAISNAIAGIVQGMQKIPWSGRVVDVRGTQVYINAGAAAGVATGMTFDIYSQGEQLVDPETHLPLGSPDQRVGGVTIVSVAPQYAVGQVSDGTGMKRNDVVRFKGAGNAP